MGNIVVKKIKKEIADFFKAAVFVSVCSFLISIFFLEPYLVSGSSMEPTLRGDCHHHEHAVIADRIIVLRYLVEEPQYGDIVIIDSRVDRERTILDDLIENPLVSFILDEGHNYLWIKRVIGKPGDVLECIDGKVYRNGVEIQEDYIKENIKAPFEKVKVPDEHIFVMGDNRNHSKDSRVVGTIPMNNVKGKVAVRFYPISKFNVF